MGKNKPGSTSPSGLPAANCRFAIDTTSWSAHAAYHSRVTVTQEPPAVQHQDTSMCSPSLGGPATLLLVAQAFR